MQNYDDYQIDDASNNQMLMNDQQIEYANTPNQRRKVGGPPLGSNYPNVESGSGDRAE